MKGRLKHKILIVIILLLMTLPGIQHLSGFFEEKPLHGAITLNPKVEFSVNSWRDGSFQSQTDLFFKDNFGFRSKFVRLNNQLNYSLFGSIAAQGVIQGEDGFLYEENYLKAYYGLDYIGNDAIQESGEKLRFVQEELGKDSIQLLVVLAPGKGSFFPEHFPKEWRKLKKQRTNYQGYVNALRANNVHFLNFKLWFDRLKDNSPYPLFPKAGIHWSKYGEYLAADSLLRYLNNDLGYQFGGVKLKGINVSAENKDGDYDIGEGANLIFTLPTYPMAYPNYEFQNSQQTDKALVVSDSYYWGLFNKGMSQKCFGNGQFWFYNEAIYPDSYTSPISVKDIDILQEVKKNKLVILLSTDANLYRFPFGFIEQLYDAMQ